MFKKKECIVSDYVKKPGPSRDLYHRDGLVRFGLVLKLAYASYQRFCFVLFLLSFCFRRTEETIDDCGESGAEERGYDEYPELSCCCTTCDDGRTNASCRVYGCTGEADAEDMY